MERRKGKRQQQQQKEKHGLPLVAEDDPVEYQHEDDRLDAVVVANSARVKGSGVGHDSSSSSSSGDEAAELRSEDSDSDSDSEEDYVAYGRLDVETATEAVTEWLRQRLAPPAAAEEEEEERANTKGGRRKALSSSPSPLPATRREWSRQADIARLCRVERQVEGLAVVGLLHQAHLIRLVPPPGSGSGGSKGKGASGSSKAAPREKRKPKTAAAAADDESEEVEEEEEEGEGEVAEVVRGLGAEAAGQVGVEWVAQLQDMARLEEALTQQLGDGSVILARVLPWVRTRLAPGANDGGGKKKGGRVGGGGGKQQGGLPSTLEELLAAIEQEQWGAITHRVRPNDVVPTPAAAIHTRHTRGVCRLVVDGGRILPSLPPSPLTSCTSWS